ncbi:unnamed protein product [Effrenium voratum]|uniref:GCF C-terminal domain-containing protein n=1 Tax=Effrenium voratum TaxID=2562239 RepID=A0AA36ID19_9DINO|nr:unnamed protein product [Effrenium voratum]CAJ1413600.1 unnamed protein product [Effrenium voratum]
MALRKQLLSLDEDEDEAPVFQVKKSRLSRQMAATKAPADLAFRKRKSREEEPAPKAAAPAPKAEEPELIVSEPCPGFEDDVEPAEVGALEAVRLARAQRAAARGVPVKQGASAPAPTETSARIKALAAAAQRELQEEEEPEDAAEDWAQRQLAVGLHKRKAQAPVEELDLEQEIMQLNQEGVSQVRKAAERVAKGHKGEEAVRKQETGLLVPSDAMAKLWESLQGLESSATNREAKLEELKSQRDAAQDELREIERQDKQLNRTLRCVRELEESAWSLGGLLDEKSGKCKQATQMLAQIEEDFVQRRSRRRMRDMAAALRAVGASLTYQQSCAEADDGEDKEKDPEEEEKKQAASRERRRQRRLLRKPTLDGWDTSDVSEDDGFQQASKDRSSFCDAVHCQLFKDVSEEFSSASAVLKALKSSKQKLQEEYRQAFVHLALPEVFGFFVEHSTLWWDPLSLCATHGANWGPKKALLSTQLEAFDWFEDMAAFTEIMGDDDPDGELVPKIVKQCIFPEVARRLRQCWDVTCLEQSKKVAALLDECLLFEVGEDGGFNTLLQAALERLQMGLRDFAPEVFVPATSVTAWYTSEARTRLLWRCCKIAHCAAQLEGRLPEEQLKPLLLEIFGTRVAPHLQAPRRHPQEMQLVERFLEILPERWLEPLPAALAPLRDALGPRAPANCEATRPRAVQALQRMKCWDEAEALKL